MRTKFKLRSSPSPLKKQKLSRQARIDKAERDTKYMKGPYKAKKAENQRKRRAALKRGVDLTGKDYDHKRGRFVSVKSNRGNEGKGTKSEGSKKYMA